MIRAAARSYRAADPAGARGALDSLDHLRRQFIRDDNLQLNLGQKIDHVLGAAVEFGMALLASEALHFADRQPLHPDARERLFDLVELERLDYRLNLLHMIPPGAQPDGRPLPLSTNLICSR